MVTTYVGKHLSDRGGVQNFDRGGFRKFSKQGRLGVVSGFAK